MAGVSLDQTLWSATGRGLTSKAAALDSRGQGNFLSGSWPLPQDDQTLSLRSATEVDIG